MSELPRGTVTFLFTDIEGSTALWERDRVATAAAVAEQIALLDAAIEAHGGVHFKTIGDAVQVAFPTAPAAVAATLAGQHALLATSWGEAGPLRVRMALHAGEAAPDDRGDYLAAPLNRLSRLLATGHGGQILLTQAVQQLARGQLPDNAELRDLGEHRLRDLLEPERVYQVLHPDLPANCPPLSSLDTRPHNLPRQPTPFLGREREIGELVRLLQRDDVQLLTLTGTGGTGKTRLALQAAAELIDHFDDGVYFVPLAPLSDPALIAPAIGNALGIREEGERSLAERLRDALATKHLLLVLDNMEHLVEGAPLVGELLTSSPHLKVLATSRLPLRLRAEREYPVPPLDLPRRMPPPLPEHLTQYTAVQLFIERAQAVNPDFVLDNENAPAVAEICHRLDGLPLAIELAAARVRMLSPQGMLPRVEKRLPLLTGGARDAPARHRTLRETIRWSHDLLSEQDQILFSAARGLRRWGDPRSSGGGRQPGRRPRHLRRIGTAG
jgi:class 3 adenylate cyclase